MKILVTGAKGFIGSHISDELEAQGHTVDRHSRGLAIGYSHDLIVHCAAAAGPWHTPADIMRDNIDLTRAVISYATKRQTPIINMSSISVHGEPQEPVVSPSSPFWTGTSIYGKSKLAVEQMLAISMLDHINLRMPGVIGPKAHLKNWIPIITRKLLAGETISIYNPKSAFNNVVHVEDLARFVAHLALLGFDSETFTLCAGTTMSVEHVVENLARALDIDNPRMITREAWSQPWCIDCTLAQEMGYQPMTLLEILTKYASYALDHRTQTELDL